jgi:putative transposase
MQDNFAVFLARLALKANADPSMALISVPIGDGGNPSPSGEARLVSRGRVRHDRLGAPTKSDRKVHLVWVPKDRKAALSGEVALRGRDLWRQMAAEQEREMVSGKGARAHVHLFLAYRPNQDGSQIVPWLKGISSRVLLQEFPPLRKKFWGRHLWARGYLAVSSGTITDEMIREYIEEQEGEQIADDSRFPIDHS